MYIVYVVTYVINRHLYFNISFNIITLYSVLSLPIVKPVVHVACGRHHTLALTQGKPLLWLLY